MPLSTFLRSAQEKIHQTSYWPAEEEIFIFKLILHIFWAMSLHFFTASINKALKAVNLEFHRPCFVVFLISALVKKNNKNRNKIPQVEELLSQKIKKSD